MGQCVEHDCRWWLNVAGQHPQSGEVIDRWGCAVEFLPMLLIEGARHSRETAVQTSASNELNRQALRSAALGPTPEFLRLIGVNRGE